MKNVIQLRNELCDVFAKLRTNKIKTAQAKELVGAAGKIISSVKVELEYSAQRKEVPVIDFLGGDKPPLQRAKA